MSETYFETFVSALKECHSRKGVLGKENLIYPPSEHSNYPQTPLNAVTFGNMGVDGVHYAIIRINGEIRDDSPIIQISPMDSDSYSLLAVNLIDYFAAACGVPQSKMRSIFEKERIGISTLVEFLKGNFDHSRIWNRERPREPFLHLLEISDA